MEREVVIRFAPPNGGERPDGTPGGEEVRGTVTAAGNRPMPFTGWLQLLGHLEVLSGIRRPDAPDEPSAQ